MNYKRDSPIQKKHLFDISNGKLQSVAKNHKVTQVLQDGQKKKYKLRGRYYKEGKIAK